ncbi:MAG: 3'(2'),5'-bisphosphate nucleotidase CysQ [Micromonosporaceae bacterium]|nr:3'(2'),5'-bisphosphate nucleotidase CysQ [Micromonosporaceae bacterium]
MPPAVDGAFARWLADKAGALLRDLRADRGYSDPEALRAAGDKYSHHLIATELARWRPGDEVFSEEAVSDVARRVAADRVWIVDPLDGTREFGEPGRTDWAVHIGLWARDSSAPFHLGAAAIALPAQHSVLGTDFPPGYPPMSPAAAAGGALRLAVSRSRAPALVTALAEQLHAELVPMGSAGAKIAAVIAGDADAYVHAGGQYEWDSAAPVAVASATGLHCSRIDGSALEYNRPDPFLPDLLVCRKDLATRILNVLNAAH